MFLFPHTKDVTSSLMPQTVQGWKPCVLPQGALSLALDKLLKPGQVLPMLYYNLLVLLGTKKYLGSFRKLVKRGQKLTVKILGGWGGASLVFALTTIYAVFTSSKGRRDSVNCVCFVLKPLTYVNGDGCGKPDLAFSWHTLCSSTHPHWGRWTCVWLFEHKDETDCLASYPGSW